MSRILIESNDIDDDDDDAAAEELNQTTTNNNNNKLQQSLAGLDMNKFINYIKYDSNNLWIFVDNLGTIYKWRFNNKRFLKINNMYGRHNQILNETITKKLWNKFKKFMQENLFILITINDNNCNLLLYYCHRRVLNVLNGQNILIFGNIMVCFHNFYNIINDANNDENNNNHYELERMRHIKLNGRTFKFRCQSSIHKLFICTNDIIDNRIHFDWINRLPIDDCNNQQEQNDNDQQQQLSSLSINDNDNETED